METILIGRNIYTVIFKFNFTKFRVMIKGYGFYADVGLYYRISYYYYTAQLYTGMDFFRKLHTSRYLFTVSKWSPLLPFWFPSAFRRLWLNDRPTCSASSSDGIPVDEDELSANR